MKRVLPTATTWMIVAAFCGGGGGIPGGRCCAQWMGPTTPPTATRESTEQAPADFERVASRAPHTVPAWGTQDAASLADTEILERLSLAYRRVVERVQPAVVHIEANKPQSASGGDSVTEAGSGVIVRLADRTCVLTNHHVIRDTPNANIHIHVPDGQRLHPARCLWDDASDVAVLDLDQAPLPTVPIGNSDLAQIGDIVLAFGSPFGLSRSVSHGIISAKGRRNLELGIGAVKIQDFIQTDAAINPGNSGGPLLNIRGEVIGLNTAIASNSGGNDGIAFSIPANLAVRIAEQLLQQGTVTRPYLGVHLDNQWNITRDTFDPVPRSGAKVARVVPGTSAEGAGLRPGDLITKINALGIEDDSHLIAIMAMLDAQGECELTVEREGQPMRLSLPLRPRKR